MDKTIDEKSKIREETKVLSDEELLGKFFAENTLEVEDRGFSNRVMRRLPDGSARLNRIWTVICAVAVVAVFILTKGWVTLTGTFQGLLADAVTGVSQVTLASAFATVVTLSALACYGLVTNAK